MDLGDFGYGQVWGLNDAGVIVGETSDYRAFYYANGTVTDIGAGNGSYATAINNNGVITGYANSQAFVYANGQITNLGQAGSSFSIATAVNDSGAVVGVSQASNNGQYPFVYANGTLTSL